MSLDIIVGPMFSGKTTHLINLYNKYLKNNYKVIAINHIIDDRYSDTLLSSHNKVMIPCIKTNKLFNIINDVNDYDYILINEAQFFEDIVEFTINMIKNNKHLCIVGLDGDFKKNKFGNLLDLIPHCDTIIKLKSKCYNCNNNGIFSKRITDEKEQIIVGSNNYVPTCRICY